MSKIEELASSIQSNRKKLIKKEELHNFIIETIVLVGEINDAYKKLYEGSESNPAILKEVEDKLDKIKEEYDNLFLANDDGGIKIEELHNQISNIKKYHDELLNGDQSTKTSVDNFKEEITNLYNFLFNKDADGKNKADNVKNSIEEINLFYEKLSNSENGIDGEIEKIYESISKKYNDLYTQDEEGNFKIKKLDDDIKKITDFKDEINNVISPFLEETKADIKIKQQEVASLLAGSSGGSLIQGFLESKKEYRQEPNYKKFNKFSVKSFLLFLYNIFLFFINFFTVAIDYILFIFPLIISVTIFIQPELVSKIINNNVPGNSISAYLASLNFYSRLIISLPLWWISWFGQRSISHKRRLAEEYNHKAQVTKMYLNFSSRETQGSYPISEKAKEDLDQKLIEVIARHPGQVFGKDETMIDKIIQTIRAIRGAKNNLINDTMDKVKEKIS